MAWPRWSGIDTLSQRIQHLQQQAEWNSRPGPGGKGKGSKGYSKGGMKGQGGKKGGGKGDQGQDQGQGKGGGIPCKVCGKNGHKKAECMHRDKTCDICHKTGHLKRVCREAGKDGGVAADKATPTPLDSGK